MTTQHTPLEDHSHTTRPRVFHFYYSPVDPDGTRHTYCGRTIPARRAVHKATRSLAPWEYCTDCEHVHKMEQQLLDL